MPKMNTIERNVTDMINPAYAKRPDSVSSSRDGMEGIFGGKKKIPETTNTTTNQNNIATTVEIVKR